MNTRTLLAGVYFKYNFTSIGNRSLLSNFIVMDMTIDHKRRKGKFLMTDLELVREDDLTLPNYKTFDVVSHLGAILKVGDTVACFDLTRLNINNDDWGAWKKKSLHEVV